MKKILCYLGILVLLFLLLLPPALRIFLKDKEEVEEKIVTKSILVCQNENFITTTKYEGVDIKLIAIKRTKQISEDGSEIVYDTNLDKLIDSIKTDPTITYEENETASLITIDFDIYNHEYLDLSLITKPINDQKTYYESENLTCSIKELS